MGDRGSRIRAWDRRVREGATPDLEVMDRSGIFAPRAWGDPGTRACRTE